jgi:hypothetical protein
LTNDEDVCIELADEVDVSERAVLVIPATEDDDDTSLDVHHLTVIEPHYVAYADIKLGEGTAGFHHVIGAPGVDNPT